MTLLKIGRTELRRNSNQLGLIEHLRAHESGDMSHVSQNTLFERRTVIKITPVIQFLEIQVRQAPKIKFEDIAEV